MRLTQYLIEASQKTGELYKQFNQDFRNALGIDPPTATQLTGWLNRRTHKAGQNEALDFATDWFLKRGFLQQKGSMVVPTPRGSELRQSLVADRRGTGDDQLAAASGKGHKALRRFFMDVTDAATKEFLSTLDEVTLEQIGKARELEQDDIAILNGIRERAENHRERASFVEAMRAKNPQRLDRLQALGFIDEKGNFNKGQWDTMVQTVNSLDPARIKTLIPQFFEWSTHSSGNVARNVNRILFAIHPDSRNRSEKGRYVWDMIKNLDDNTFTMLQNGKKPRQGELSEEAYNLLTTVVASVVRSFPNTKSADELIQQLDDAFSSRVDFKSLDRSADKTASRRQGVKDTLRQF